tara:strand:+ start:119 stop:535 length:417 start_codon:yes stop_codon:yes gene_type:complete
MAETLDFELVSPARLLISEPVEMVVVPGTEGAFGVLPLHAPTLSTLRPGFIDVYKDGAVAERYFVTGGFAEVTRTTCTVLVDEAIPGAQANRQYAADQLSKAQAALAQASDEAAKTSATAALAAAEVVVETIAREVGA